MTASVNRLDRDGAVASQVPVHPVRVGACAQWQHSRHAHHTTGAKRARGMQPASEARWLKTRTPGLGAGGLAVRPARCPKRRPLPRPCGAPGLSYVVIDSWPSQTRRRGNGGHSVKHSRITHEASARCDARCGRARLRKTPRDDASSHADTGIGAPAATHRTVTHWVCA